MISLSHLHQAFSYLIAIGIAMLVIVVTQVTVWSVDRNPPFYTVEAGARPAKPGQTTTVSAVVKRDLSRRCSVVYSRVFYDSVGTRFDLTGEPKMTNAKGIDDLERRMPNELKFGIAIPDAAAKGKAAIVTYLDYRCNPIHAWWPIPVIMSVNVDVL